MIATPIRKPTIACCSPPMPSIQIEIPAPNASRIATTASTSAPPSVDKAGTISSAPERTTMTAIKVVTSENSAIRRDQMASRDVGSSAMRRRTIFARFHGFGPFPRREGYWLRSGHAIYRMRGNRDVSEALIIGPPLTSHG